MTLGRVAFKPIDEPSFGGAEKQPVSTRLLQRDKELLTTVHCFLVDVVAALEFGLERKLAAQRVVSTALTPDADVRVGGDPLAKIQNPEVLKHFLDDGLVHQLSSVPPTPETRAPEFPSIRDRLQELGSRGTAHCESTATGTRPPDPSAAEPPP